MTIFALNAISPLEGRYSDKLTDLRPIFSEYGLIKARVTVEIRWLQWLSNEASLKEVPLFSNETTVFLDSLITHFSEEDALAIKAIEKETNHDVKAVEYFLKQLFAQHPELAGVSEFIHFGCTSEDINNIAYGLMLKTSCTTLLIPLLEQVKATLQELAHENAESAMLARTHGQPATPTTAGKEFANVCARLDYPLQQLKTIRYKGKLNGASGNYNAFYTAYPMVNWEMLSQHFIESIGLEWNPYTTQIEPHDDIADFFNTLQRINTILLDFNRDMWGYIALNYFTLKTVSHEVGSSTMPHKVNPIDFENAEGNLGLANALANHMATKLPISRWQRDLSDSTVLRSMGVAIGYCLLAYQSTLKGLSKICLNKAALQADLANHWEILAEPIQMVMRRYGIPEPYEKLKAFSRGRSITQPLLHAFIHELTLPPDIKQILCELTPSNYIGLASALARKI